MSDHLRLVTPKVNRNSSGDIGACLVSGNSNVSRRRGNYGTVIER